jgi:hypothetical protein
LAFARKSSPSTGPLSSAGPSVEALRLGVLWYLTDDESHNDDGKHITYLDPTRPTGRALRDLDPDLYQRLGSVVVLDRSVAELERSGSLPPGTVTFAEHLRLNDLPTSAIAARLARRNQWLDDALLQLSDCDVVFADPDNGIRTSDHERGRHLDKSEKHAFVDELVGFSSRGQPVVVYHHADRSAPVPIQAQRRLSDLGAMIDSPIAAVRASRGTTRLFLVAGAGPTADHLRVRLRDLEHSPWSSELTVIWPDRI